jgi:superoxide dismutase, Cu-Zn family
VRHSPISGVSDQPSTLPLFASLCGSGSLLTETRRGNLMRKIFIAIVGVVAIATAGSAIAAGMDAASATLKDPEGNEVGSVELRAVPSGVLLHVEIDGLPAGAHAFHVHAVGKCEPPFESAEGHFNPGEKQHGLMNPAGPHAGDMPNIHVPDSGELEIEILTTGLSLDESLFDADGAAIIVHEGSDDYESDPAGHAGPRIACGVIEQ